MARWTILLFVCHGFNIASYRPLLPIIDANTPTALQYSGCQYMVSSTCGTLHSHERQGTRERCPGYKRSSPAWMSYETSGHNEQSDSSMLLMTMFSYNHSLLVSLRVWRSYWLVPRLHSLQNVNLVPVTRHHMPFSSSQCVKD